MAKFVVLAAVLLLVAAAIPSAVLADIPSNAVTVTVSGNGTWSGGVLSVSLFPGESKDFRIEVRSNVNFSMHVRAMATPGCSASGNATACFQPVESTLAAGALGVFNLTVSADAAAPPGTFAISLLVDTDTEGPAPPPSPHHIALAAGQSTVVAGGSNQLIATVFDANNNPLSGIPVTWTVASGTATLSSRDAMTDSNGQAKATALSAVAGVSIVRCAVSNSLSILGAISLTWTAAPSNGGDGEPPDDVPAGQPAWKVFLIGILIIGGGFAGYTLYKRRKEKALEVDPLLVGGEPKDTLDLD